MALKLGQRADDNRHGSSRPKSEESAHMSRFNDLRISVRLAIGFGALILAMAIIAFSSYRALGTAGERAAAVKEKDIVALELSAAFERRLERIGLLLTQHLYVYDGDVAKQDEIAATVESLRGQNVQTMERLRGLLDTEEARAAVERADAVRTKFAAAYTEALDRSRAETVANAEERDGSRDYYLETALPALERVEKASDDLVELITTDADAQGDATTAAAASGKRTLVIVLAIAILLAAVVAWLISRSVSGPASRLVERMRRLSAEDVTALRAGVDAFARGDLTVTAETTTPAIDEITGDELGQLSTSFNEIRAELGATVEAYNTSRAQLTALIGRVTKASQRMSAASQQMASTSEEAGRAVSEIANAVGDVAQGAERQVQMVSEARASAEQTAEAAANAREVAQRGVESAGEADGAMRAVRESSEAVSAAMRELAGKSEQIGGIVETITGIAGQTNLLALNAAIEAARAGEQGRGFAVVAEEVRKLAEESQRAAQSIAGLVAEIQAETRNATDVVDEGTRRTEGGVATVEQAREAFLAIGQAVEDMTVRIEQIAFATGEVASVAEQSSASAEQVSASTQQTSASTQEIAATAQEFARTAEELDQLVAGFRLTR
jgi:methyl-accepting chemotaxis protein